MPVADRWVVEEWQEAPTVERLRRAEPGVRLTLIVMDPADAPFIIAGERVEIVPGAAPRPRDLVLASASGDLLLAWAMQGIDSGRWRLRPHAGGPDLVGEPLGRASRLAKTEGTLDLGRGLGVHIARALAWAARRRAMARPLGAGLDVAWKLAHPIWPPVGLGALDELRRSVEDAYSRTLVVESYADWGSVLDPGEVEATSRFKPGGRILDIGCGAGREALGLARRGHRVTAIDVSGAMLAAARQQAQSAGLDICFVHARADEFEARPGSFDGAYVSPEVYSYIPGRRQRLATLHRIRRALTEDGVLVLFQNLAERVRLGRFVLVDAARRLARLAGVPGIAEPGDGLTREGTLSLAFKHHFFTERALEAEIRDGGFRVEDVKGACRVCRPTR